VSAWVRRYWPLVFLAIYLCFATDFTISSLWTCHPPPEGSTEAIKAEYAKNCSYLHGPLRIGLRWIIDFIDVHNGFFVVLFTGGLVAFTAALWRSTDKLWEAGERQLRHFKSEAARARFDRLKDTQRLVEQIGIARETSDAARRSADAAYSTEQARFFIVFSGNNISAVLDRIGHPEDYRQVFSVIGEQTPPAIEYSFRNYGKTPGIIKELSLGMKISREPFDPVFPMSFKTFREYMIGGGDTWGPETFQFDRALTRAEAAAISSNVEALWFFGRIDYQDVFGSDHTHRFFFKTIVLKDELYLQPVDHKHYNQNS
jgi:hypothetical protein